MFSQQCCWRSKSPVTWHRVVGRAVVDKNHEDEGTEILWHIEKYWPSGTASHTKRLHKETSIDLYKSQATKTYFIFVLPCIVTNFFLNNQPDALIIQIYSVIKLYMFQASSLPIIRSFSTVHSALVSFLQVWWPLPSRVVEFHPDSAWNCTHKYIYTLMGTLLPV